MVITLFIFGNLSLKNAYCKALNLFGFVQSRWNKETNAPSYWSPSFKKLKDFHRSSSQTLVAINSEIADTIPYPAFPRISSNKLTNILAATS